MGLAISLISERAPDVTCHTEAMTHKLHQKQLMNFKYSEKFPGKMQKQLILRQQKGVHETDLH